MKWEMGILSPDSSYLSSSSWFHEGTKWSPAENKAFEKALALYDKDTPDRWERVAEMVPGKTVGDVIRQYKELEDDVTSIEAGLMDLIPIPDYTTSSPFTLEWGGAHRPAFVAGGGKRPPANRAPEHERKKGVPWTEEEHKLFLMGLKKHGKGDWRNISRNFVITRTPTQVASHAQKFFIRQNSGGKDKRRASIHDITTVSIDEHQMASPDTKKRCDDSPDQAGVALSQPQQQPDSGVHKRPFSWNHQGNIGMAISGFSSASPGNLFAYAFGPQTIHESIFGSQTMAFPIQSAAQQYPFA
ncbi:transcription factor DIVARICATA-like [Ipomoea triloba]|uniref:transcription factor DIVARICATA-like n=1 Tax=Ipomoea triloba TaxID=35885 RepID=UPI00125E392E|nr:transcription factor DIVARICATA-like [Ipomoea triloba]